MKIHEFLGIMEDALAEPNEDRPDFLCRFCTMSLKFEHDEDDDDNNIPFSITRAMAARVIA